MKIAITGGAGFIGSHLTQAYLNAGHDVIVIDTLVNSSDSVSHALDPRARFYPVDIRDSKLATILQHERPDILSYHVAQQKSSMPTEQALIDADLHIRGLLNVLHACISASVSKFIFASAGNDLYTSGDADTSPIREGAALSPRHPSAISKVAGEEYVRYYTRYYGMTHTILRYADVYGDLRTGQAQHPLTYFVNMLRACQRPIIRGTGRDGRDALFIDDVVRANVYALKRGKNVTLHISSGHAYDLNSFYSTAAHLLSSDLKPVYISESLAKPTTIALDNSLAQKVLGWYPQITLQEGVRRVVEASTGKGALMSSVEDFLHASIETSLDGVYALSTAQETGHRTLATALV